MSGISHWEFERFEAYRVNPPFVRMVAALPVFAIGYKADWTGISDYPGGRPEFTLGEAFINANGTDICLLIVYARWICIPFSLIGAFFAYRWARELYGNPAGIVTLILYVFEPNLLAHGELITPDVACTSLGIVAGYSFWKWLKQPTWARAAIAGTALGVAELTKMSWLILFGLWPILWFSWCLMLPKRFNQRRVDDDSRKSSTVADPPTASVEVNSFKPVDFCSPRNRFARGAQLAIIILLALYVLNLAYAFDGSGTRLQDFRFVSSALTGNAKSGREGNRFRNTLLDRIPLPFPKQYVLGHDTQRKDFEGFGHRSFLRGEWQDKGWWYYYLYGLWVKLPCGTWALFAIIVFTRLRCRNRPTSIRDELVLLVPAITLLVVVSSQTEFSIHLRYAFPALGIMLIFIGQAGAFLTRNEPVRTILACSAITYSVASGIAAYPDHLSYFNDFVGGPQYGHKHLLGSSLDWGQGIHEAIAWIKENESSSKVEIEMQHRAIGRLLLEQTPKVSYIRPYSSQEERLILLSAEEFSDRVNRRRSNKKQSSESFIKRFRLGIVLLRVEKRAGAN